MRSTLRLLSFLLVVLSLTGCGIFQPTTGSVQVHFIYVGQGDSILIVSPKGKIALIDAGNPDSGALEYLQAMGITHLDLVVATHSHGDHIGGMAEVLLAIPAKRVVTNGRPHTTELYERFMDAIEETKAQYLEAERGDRLALGSLVFDVLHPLNQSKLVSPRRNNDSIVLSLMYGETTFLFVGDAEKEAEAHMLEYGIQLKADILKVGHHGSRSSSSPEFLAAVSPSVAVYSAGVNNDLGFPHAKTINALESVGAEVYGTDVYGTIAITADKNGYLIKTQEDWNPLNIESTYEEEE